MSTDADAKPMSPITTIIRFFPRITRHIPAKTWTKVGIGVGIGSIALGSVLYIKEQDISIRSTVTRGATAIRQYLGAKSPVLGTSDEPSGKNALLERDYEMWKAVVATRPDYRDGFFTLATLAYRLGYYQESKTYLEEVRRIDPNYPEIKTVERLLEGK